MRLGYWSILDFVWVFAPLLSIGLILGAERRAYLALPEKDRVGRTNSTWTGIVGFICVCVIVCALYINTVRATIHSGLANRGYDVVAVNVWLYHPHTALIRQYCDEYVPVIPRRLSTDLYDAHESTDDLFIDDPLSPLASPSQRGYRYCGVDTSLLPGH